MRCEIKFLEKKNRKMVLQLIEAWYWASSASFHTFLLIPPAVFILFGLFNVHVHVGGKMGDPIQQRENLYKLIISQLRYDGLEAVAATLSKIVNTASPCPPSARLHQVVNLGVQAENDGARPEAQVIPGLSAPVTSNKGIDMEYEPEGNKNHSANGESANAAVEGFLSNLKLQKVSENAEKEQLPKQPDSPSKEEVRKHIILITTGRRPKPEELNVVVADESKAHGDSDVCVNVKKELQRFNISQEIFAKVALGKTQGYLSEILRQGEKAYSSPDKMFSKGQKNFDIMRMFLKLPEHERRRRYAAKAEELRIEKLRKREVEQGGSHETPRKKPKQVIPMDAKMATERLCDPRNKNCSAEKKETLASQQRNNESVGDYFKNLKYEERMRGILSNFGSDSGEEEETVEGRDMRHDSDVCTLRASPRKSLAPVSLNNKSQVLKSSSVAEVISRDSFEDEVETSKIVALVKKSTKRSSPERPSDATAIPSSPLPNISQCASDQGQDPGSIDKFPNTSFELQVERDPGFLTRDTKMEVFHPISGEELFVVQLEESAIPSRVHLSPM